jgi:hypothetical protein
VLRAIIGYFLVIIVCFGVGLMMVGYLMEKNARGLVLSVVEFGRMELL